MPSTASVGVATALLSAVANGIQNGSTFALPPNCTMLSWQTTFGSAPASGTINLQLSNDGTNWTTIDSSTSTAGELRLIPSVAALFVRATISAQSGGTTTTVTITTKASGGSSPISFAAEIFTSMLQTASVGTIQTTIAEVFLPANLLKNNGDKLRFEAWTFSANNANLKLTGVVLGTLAPTTIASRSGVADANIPRVHVGTVVRTGAATGQSWGGVHAQGQATLITLSTTGETWSNSLAFKVVATGTTTGDIINRGFTVVYEPVGGTYVGI